MLSENAFLFALVIGCSISTSLADISQCRMTISPWRWSSIGPSMLYPPTSVHVTPDAKVWLLLSTILEKTWSSLTISAASLLLRKPSQHTTPQYPACAFLSNQLNVIWGAVNWDPVHSTPYHVLLNGWPNHICQVLGSSRGIQDNLSTEDGILTKGDYICIPPELFDHTLKDLHQGY